jgi:hypothetical protein
MSKVTPTHTPDWYVKWVATILIFVAVACRSVEEVPKIYDITLSFFGCVGWWYVAWVWGDRALMTLNTALLSMLFMALVRYVTTYTMV